MRTKVWLRVGGFVLLVGGIAVLGYILHPYISSALTVIPTAPALTSVPATGVLLTASSVADNELDNEPEDLAPTATQVPVKPVPADVVATATATLLPTPTLTPVPTGETPVRIRIADIELDAPVYAIGWVYSTSGGQRVPVWDVPDEFAAGWHKTSSLLGMVGNTVINGHNTNNGEVFRDLYKLDIGAIIEMVSESGTVFTFQITEKYILPEAGQPLAVRLKNADYIQETLDERLTMVTCHPYGSLRNRLIVIAKPFDSVRSVVPPDSQKGE